ncbi:MAG: ANTAR domain-containing protein [Hyphomicrobiales bacterium]|jgi:AmiR/NasT family two-component response regulator|nr:MAG: ANTAR domain-containing protein [Hyphomicrobiales bacterium]
MNGLPNFSGRKAVVVHPEDQNCEILLPQLRKLGLSAEAHWPVARVKPDSLDVIFFDADRGYDGQFPWEAGQAPVPSIALLGSEAPGRIEWTLRQMPDAYIQKPVRTGGVFSVLSIAFHHYRHHRRMKHKLDDLNWRLSARPAVVAAIQILGSELGLDNDESYQLLRTHAMRQRISVESLCERISLLNSLAPLDLRARHQQQ